MFDGFAHVWTPVELSRRLGTKPVQVKLAGEPIVLFRGKDKQVGALIDRCPHRGVALSLGKVNEQGCLTCPFHAWEFEANGACARVPLNEISAEKRERLSATALPCRDLGGLIWVYTAPGATAPTEPVVPEALRDPSFVTWRVAQSWSCHWTRAMENMLDSPHVPFIHRRTIGRFVRSKMRPDSVMDVRVEPFAEGLRSNAALDGTASPGWLEWRPPNGMCLHIPIPGRSMRIHVWCVPEDQQHTRMIVVSARNFGRWNPLARLFDEVNRLILLEDRAVVESSQPPEVPPPAAEASVASDRFTLAFRKYYLQQLKSSRAEEPSRLVVLKEPGEPQKTLAPPAEQGTGVTALN